MHLALLNHLKFLSREIALVEVKSKLNYQS